MRYDIKEGEIPLTMKNLETALINYRGVKAFYQRGGEVVHISEVMDIDPQRATWENAGIMTIAPVTRLYLRQYADQAAEWFRYNGRTQSFARCNFPVQLAMEYLEMYNTWKLPVLTGITETPTIKPNGNVLDTEGYDPETGLVFFKRGINFPEIPEYPTREEALAALARIKTLFQGFPFLTEAHRSVALAGLLTAINRRAFTICPLFAITAPRAGSGKSLLVDAISIVMRGKSAAVFWIPEDENEAEKRLAGALWKGARLVSLDNLERPLSGEFLNQMITQETLTIRPLGSSRQIELQNLSTIFATGNNLRVDGDMVRRVMMCEIDPQVERPFERVFEVNLKEYARDNRAQLASDAVLVVRAYIAAGKPELKLRPYGDFTQWTSLIRAPLVWLGEPDPIDTIEDVISEDPQGDSLGLLLEQLERHYGRNHFRIADVIDLARMTQRSFAGTDEYVNKELFGALEMIPKANAPWFNAKVIGHFFKRNMRRIQDGRALFKGSKVQGYQYYYLKVKSKADDVF